MKKKINFYIFNNYKTNVFILFLNIKRVLNNIS